MGLYNNRVFDTHTGYKAVYFQPEFVEWMKNTMPTASYKMRYRKVRRGGWTSEAVDAEISFPNCGSRMVFEIAWVR